MANEAELKISSTSVERTTVAVDALVASLIKLGKGAGSAEGSSDGLSAAQKRATAAVESSNIASEKAIALLALEQKGLEKSSQEYAQLKAAILAKEAAAKKGIETSSKEYTALKAGITAKEKATAETKKLAAEQRAVTAATKKAETAAKKLAAQEKKLKSSTMKTGMEFKSFTGYLDKATKQVQLIDGPLGGVASRMTALSSIVKSGAFRFAAVALSVGLAVKALWSGADVADRNIVAMKGLEAQLTATNYAAGFTASSLDNFSRSLALATLDNTEGIQELVSVMLSFDKVSESTFTKAIELSQDMGIALKQSPVTAAKTLGKVLQNPIKNYLQLKRSGIEFTAEEKKQLKVLQEKNDIHAAQAVVLEKVASKFNDVAKAQTASLAGDRDTLSQNWEELWELLGTKLIPTFRAVAQAANTVVTTTREIFETDAEEEFRTWARGSQYYNLSTEALNKSLEDTNAKIKELEASEKEKTSTVKRSRSQYRNMTLEEKERIATLKAEKQAIIDLAAEEEKKNRPKTDRHGRRRDRKSSNTTDTKEEEESLEFLKLKAKELTELAEKRIIAETGVGYVVSAEAKKEIDALELKVSQQERLSKAYLLTGDTRSQVYRDEKAMIAAEAVALKTGLNLKSEEGKAYIANLKQLSNLTEARIKENTIIQSGKATKTKIRNLQKELTLNGLLSKGIREESDEYILASIAIDAKNKALQAGFKVGSDEYNQMIKNSEGLGEYTIALQKLEDAKTAGVGTTLRGNSFDTDSLIQAQQDKNDQLAALRRLNLTDVEVVAARENAIRQEYADAASEATGVTLAYNTEGKLEALSERDALLAERDETLRQLEIDRKDLRLEDEEAFQERRRAIIAESEQAIADSSKEIFERSAAHKLAVETQSTADSIASGLESLAAVATNNEKLDKMAKASAIFSASVGLVDSLSEISSNESLSTYQKFAAYAGAAAKGASIISMASELNTPSYANGIVDISGAGTGRSDSIKANIANGESVITATATNRHKDTLRRMNAGLPIDGSTGSSVSMPLSINISGDASEQTVSLIEQKLLAFETRVAQISNGTARQTIQSEQRVGGLFNRI